MSKIVLLRHGQASFGSSHYDKLSELGRLQAKKVGEYFNQCDIQFDQIVHGAMSRQAETAQIVAKTISFSPQLVTDLGANEFDSESLVKNYLPQLAKQSERHHQMIFGDNNWFKSDDNFRLIFSQLIELWQNNEQSSFESWLKFKVRVKQFLTELGANQNANQRVLVATSGGLISLAIMSLLGVNDKQFSRVNLSINNASLTEIKLADEQPSGDSNLVGEILSFNNISPLILAKDKQLITRK